MEANDQGPTTNYQQRFFFPHLVTALVSRAQQVHIQPNRSRDAGGRLVCVPGPPSIRRVFELTGVDTVVEWVEGPGEVA